MRRRQQLRPDTFPFLAVLLCTMGSLILVLMVFDRKARLAACARAEAAWRKEEEDEASKAALLAAAEERRLGQEREQLAHLAAEERRLNIDHDRVRARLAAVLRALEEGPADGFVVKKKQVADKTAQARQDFLLRQTELTRASRAAEGLRSERERLTAELLSLEASLRWLRAERLREQQTWSVVPYVGRRGQNVRPHYVECTAEGLIFHPDRRTLTGIYLAPESVRDEVRKRTERPARTGPQPYWMLLVRPDGIGSYYVFLSAVKALDLSYGYEFVDPDWVLDFPDPSKAPLPPTPVATVKPPPRPRRLVGVIARGAAQGQGRIPRLPSTSPIAVASAAAGGGSPHGPGGPGGVPGSAAPGFVAGSGGGPPGSPGAGGVYGGPGGGSGLPGMGTGGNAVAGGWPGNSSPGGGLPGGGASGNDFAGGGVPGQGGSGPGGGSAVGEGQQGGTGTGPPGTGPFGGTGSGYTGTPGTGPFGGTGPGQTGPPGNGPGGGAGPGQTGTPGTLLPGKAGVVGSGDPSSTSMFPTGDPGAGTASSPPTLGAGVGGTGTAPGAVSGPGGGAGTATGPGTGPGNGDGTGSAAGGVPGGASGSGSAAAQLGQPRPPSLPALFPSPGGGEGSGSGGAAPPGAAGGTVSSSGSGGGGDGAPGGGKGTGEAGPSGGGPGTAGAAGGPGGAAGPQNGSGGSPDPLGLSLGASGSARSGVYGPGGTGQQRGSAPGEQEARPPGPLPPDKAVAAGLPKLTAGAAPGGEPTGDGDGFRSPHANGLPTPPPDTSRPRRPRPRALRPASRYGDDEWVLVVDCNGRGVRLSPSQLSIPLQELARGQGGDALLERTVANMIERRRALQDPAAPPFRPQIRFVIHRDGLRSFHAALPALETIRVPKRTVMLDE